MDVDGFFRQDENFPGRWGREYQRFVKRRRTLRNVTHKTLVWYRGCWLAVRDHIRDAETERDLRRGIEDAMEALVERGCGPVTVNTYLRGITAWCNAMVLDEVLSKAIKIEKLRTEKKVRTTMSDEEIEAIWKYQPKTRHEKQIRAMMLLGMDAGLRSMELRMLRTENVDLDAGMVLVDGKGRKQRRIPISFEITRVMRDYLDTRLDPYAELAFASDTGTAIIHRNFYRRVSLMCAKAGIRRINPHLLRHTFGSKFATSGGPLHSLQALMGHSSLTTTSNYLHSSGEHLREAHAKHSPLSKITRRKPAA